MWLKQTRNVNNAATNIVYFNLLAVHCGPSKTLVLTKYSSNLMILQSRFLAVLLFKKSQMSRALPSLSKSQISYHSPPLTRTEVWQRNERHFVCQKIKMKPDKELSIFRF